MKHNFSYTKMWAFLFSFVILATIGILFITKTNKKEDVVIAHNYTNITVSEKRIIPASGGFYWYKDTEYIIVGVSETGNTITTWVDANIYDLYNVGDTIFYCENHNKLKIYEWKNYNIYA